MTGIDAHVRFDIDPVSLARLRTVLADREERARVVTPALNAIADDFLDIERARFAGAGHWKPLTPEWAARKAAGGRSPLPLAGGALEESLTRRGARFAVRRVSGSTVTGGTSDPVAHLHDRGTKRLPRRSPIGITRADEARWLQLVRDHLNGPARSRGL